MVTANHNPMDYNGLKLVREGARPISDASEPFPSRDSAAHGEFRDASTLGSVRAHHDKSAYIDHPLSDVDRAPAEAAEARRECRQQRRRPGDDQLAPHLPFEFVRIQHEPDGTFPNGIPHPLLPENRDAIATVLREHRADFGIAWDGDFDRSFFFDAGGRFFESCYLVSLLAKALLTRHPGGKASFLPASRCVRGRSRRRRGRRKVACIPADAEFFPDLAELPPASGPSRWRSTSSVGRG